MDVLSPKHRLFVEAYSGDLLEAMQVAGFVGQPEQLTKKGKELLLNPHVHTAIQERSKYLLKISTVVADREERQAFWTSVMRNQDPHRLPILDDFGKAKPAESVPMAQRLKAAEMLGKSEADFTENLQVSGTITVTDIISDSYQIPDDDLEAIEAEYEEIYKIKKDTEQEKEGNENQESDKPVSVGERSGGDVPSEGTSTTELQDPLAGII
jgi:hypothetical protein